MLSTLKRAEICSRFDYVPTVNFESDPFITFYGFAASGAIIRDRDVI